MNQEAIPSFTHRLGGLCGLYEKFILRSTDPSNWDKMVLNCCCLCCGCFTFTKNFYSNCLFPTKRELFWVVKVAFVEFCKANYCFSTSKEYKTIACFYGTLQSLFVNSFIVTITSRNVINVCTKEGVRCL